MIKRYRIAGICMFLMILLSAYSAGAQGVGKLKCVCIDPGHGGKDPGAVGVKTYEKHIVLGIALKLGKMLKSAYPDLKVVYTRDKDVFIDLDKRGKIANDHKADLFISIHINSNDSKAARGLETYVLGLHRSKENLQVAMKENSVIKYEEDYSVKYSGFEPNRAESYIIFSLLQNLYLEKSLLLARFVQEQMVAQTKRVDRGVRQAGYLVLKDAAMPAILVEAGFISNPEEERFLMTSSAQEKIAGAILKAVGAYKARIEGNEVNLASQEERVAPTVSTEMRHPQDDRLVYAIQVLSASGQVKNVAGLCAGEKVYELHDGERYRYYVKPSSNLEEVKENLQKIKNKVNGCFIIAVYKGKVLSTAEAQKIKQGN
ncbi:MAG: N-acetylmuramoyl-L-alanine amidase [Odoribacter sp.]|nr:N-acetylmuramoyl-L-alanine amidase [Odoribacter sp.]